MNYGSIRIYMYIYISDCDYHFFLVSRCLSPSSDQLLAIELYFTKNTESRLLSLLPCTIVPLSHTELMHGCRPLPYPIPGRSTETTSLPSYFTLPIAVNSHISSLPGSGTLPRHFRSTCTSFSGSQPQAIAKANTQTSSRVLLAAIPLIPSTGTDPPLQQRDSQEHRAYCRLHI